MSFFQKKREKLFGYGKPRPLDRNAKARIFARARALMQRTEKGRAYGTISAKAFAVLQALLWEFHNAESGWCFPSYEAIAARAGCARSTVADALKQLEAGGLLSWVHRIKRIKERCKNLLGEDGVRVRVVRTSNAYAFCDPQPIKIEALSRLSSKSENPSGTFIQVSSFTEKERSNPLFEALGRLQNAMNLSMKT